MYDLAEWYSFTFSEAFYKISVEQPVKTPTEAKKIAKNG